MPSESRKAMSDTDDLSKLDDPAFLAERRRVREELEHTLEHALAGALVARYQRLNAEFDRRAAAAWSLEGAE
jgi:hypothetical protein